MKMASINQTLMISLSILLWTAFVFLPVVMPESQYNESPSNLFHFLYFLTRSIFIATFYFNYYYLIPKYLYQNKRAKYFVLFFGLLIIVPVLCFFIRKITADAFNVFVPMDAIFTSFKLIPLLFGLLITSLGIRLLQDWVKTQQKKKEIEEEKLKSELLLLKSQINPHFLFNTLNNIRSLARKKSDDTEVAIVKLSQMMRYMMNETSAEKVPLENEIDYLKNYVDLQKIRLSNNTNVTLNLTEDTFENTIAPMLIIPFVENAFKHGVNSNEKSFIHINIKINGDDFVLQVENSISRSGFLSQDETSGIGLKNVKGRLNLIYPHKHELIVNEQPDKFSITLKINLA